MPTIVTIGWSAQTDALVPVWHSTSYQYDAENTRTVVIDALGRARLDAYDADNA